MRGVATGIITDHPHLFEVGGENYHTDFGIWEYVRGHEGDPWRLHQDPSWVGTPALPAAEGWVHRGYDTSRTWFHGEPTTTQNCSATPSPRSRPPRSNWSASASAEANGGRGIRAVSAGGRHQVAHWPIRVHELADL